MEKIILFDGISTAGKTTYSYALSKKIKYPLIHSDDFFPIISKQMSQDNMVLFTKKLMDLVYKKAETYNNIIIDGNWQFGFPKKVTSILIYTNMKNLKRNIKMRPNSDPILVIGLYKKLFKKTNDLDKAIDYISKKDIREIIELTLSKKDKKFKTRKLMNIYLQEVYNELGFGNKRKIYITSKLSYDIIIKSSELNPEEGANYITNELNLIEIKPNLKLIRDHGVNKYSMSKAFNTWEKKYNPHPTAAHMIFKKENKMLHYIASEHTTDKNSKTFKLIKKVYKKYKFDLIIVEGCRFDSGINPSKLFKHIKSLKSIEINEEDFCIILAIKNKIDFTCVEPNHETLYKELKKKGYKVQDIYGHEYIQMIPQNKRAGYDRETHNKMMPKHYKNINKVYKKIKFDPDKWYFTTFGKELDYNLIDNHDTAPIKNGTIIQQISYDGGIIRELGIMKNLFYYINRYNNILMIYGWNHLFADFNVIKDYFGEPIL